MAKTTSTPAGFDQLFYQFPYHVFVGGNYHLADSFAIFHNKIVLRKVNEDDPYFAPVIGINGTGVFKTVIPFFNASPLRGLIWASYPLGSSINNPVGISFRSSGFNTTGSVKLARMSIPADISVLYCGSGLLDILTIFTCIRLFLKKTANI
jgi:hypothetical protein